MKVQFTRIPPDDYSAYVEGETADLPEVEARRLIGLGIAAQPRGVGGDTQHLSSRTEIVGANNETQVVIQGRGANIVTVSSPEKDQVPVGSSTAGTGATTDERLGADREHALGLVKQEAGRTGGFKDETVPDKRLGKAKSATTDASVDHESAATKKAAEDAAKARAAEEKKALEAKKAAEAANK